MNYIELSVISSAPPLTLNSSPMPKLSLTPMLYTPPRSVPKPRALHPFTSFDETLHSLEEQKDETIPSQPKNLHSSQLKSPPIDMKPTSSKRGNQPRHTDIAALQSEDTKPVIKPQEDALPSIYDTTAWQPLIPRPAAAHNSSAVIDGSCSVVGGSTVKQTPPMTPTKGSPKPNAMYKRIAAKILQQLPCPNGVLLSTSKFPR